MKVLLLFCILVCVANATRIASLKSSVTARKSTFRLGKSGMHAKFSVTGKKVLLSHAQQSRVWSHVRGEGFDAMAGAYNGIMLANKEKKVLCKEKGVEQQHQ